MRRRNPAGRTPNFAARRWRPRRAADGVSRQMRHKIGARGGARANFRPPFDHPGWRNRSLAAQRRPFDPQIRPAQRLGPAEAATAAARPDPKPSRDTPKPARCPPKCSSSAARTRVRPEFRRAQRSDVVARRNWQTDASRTLDKSGAESDCRCPRCSCIHSTDRKYQAPHSAPADSLFHWPRCVGSRGTSRCEWLPARPRAGNTPPRKGNVLFVRSWEPPSQKADCRPNRDITHHRARCTPAPAPWTLPLRHRSADFHTAPPCPALPGHCAPPRRAPPRWHSG